MPTLRRSLLPATSLALVSAAAIAVLWDVANAQEGAPVRYGTDPVYGGEGPQVLSYRGQDAPDPVSEVEHVVRAGETVYALGRLYNVPPKAIIDQNGIPSPYRLRVGDVVVIPMGTPAPRAAMPQLVNAQRVQGGAQPYPVRAEPAPTYQQERSYIVQPGDTLYSLSRRFGLSVDAIAAANRLAKPYTISVDQRLFIPSAGQPAEPRTIIAGPAPSRGPDQSALSRKVVEETMAPQTLPELDRRSPFAWPVRGPVLVQFGDNVEGVKSDGINIAAPIGAPVRSAADGEVVYRGSELDGYGNLLLVKHADGWVSAYAHTDAILVRKGDVVRQGQVIAKVGRSGAVDRPQLHFQLRKDLQPLDPLVAMNAGYGSPSMTAVGLNR